MDAEGIHAELEAAQVVNRDIFDGVRAIPGLMDSVAQSVDSKLSEMNVSGCCHRLLWLFACPQLQPKVVIMSGQICAWILRTVELLSLQHLRPQSNLSGVHVCVKRQTKGTRMNTSIITLMCSYTRSQAIREQPEITQEMLHTFGDLAHGLKSGICMIGCDRLALLCSKIGDCDSTFVILLSAVLSGKTFVSSVVARYSPGHYCCIFLGWVIQIHVGKLSLSLSHTHTRTHTHTHTHSLTLTHTHACAHTTVILCRNVWSRGGQPKRRGIDLVL